jgi:hypothetical protein
MGTSPRSPLPAVAGAIPRHCLHRGLRERPWPDDCLSRFVGSPATRRLLSPAGSPNKSWRLSPGPGEPIDPASSPGHRMTPPSAAARRADMGAAHDANGMPLWLRAPQCWLMKVSGIAIQDDRLRRIGLTRRVNIFGYGHRSRPVRRCAARCPGRGFSPVIPRPGRAPMNALALATAEIEAAADYTRAEKAVAHAGPVGATLLSFRLGVPSAKSRLCRPFSERRLSTSFKRA